MAVSADTLGPFPGQSPAVGIGRLFVGPRRRAEGILAALALGLGIIVLWAIGTGAVPIAPAKALAILMEPIGPRLPVVYNDSERMVLLDLRLPRVVLGCLVGAALGVSGTALQGLFRNPLADPGLLGIASGAALCAVLVIVLGDELGLAGLMGSYALPVAAFLGGLGVTVLIYRLAQGQEGTSVAGLLLAGIALNAVAGAGTGLVIYFADDDELRTLTFWSMGSLGGATWQAVGVALPFLGLALGLLPRLARALNALLLGEAEAAGLGVDVERVKRSIVLCIALAVGASVALTGVIGFVGLVVPHLLRLMLGADHRHLLPGAALLGAALLVGADLGARTLIAPAELPIGILTSLVGGPFFIWLLVRERRVRGWL
ncbi:MAG: FecCD family ABC transporter permease [Gammaproteobacteria bacterium]